MPGNHYALALDAVAIAIFAKEHAFADAIIDRRNFRRQMINAGREEQTVTVELVAFGPQPKDAVFFRDAFNFFLREFRPVPLRLTASPVQKIAAFDRSG